MMLPLPLPVRSTATYMLKHAASDSVTGEETFLASVLCCRSFLEKKKRKGAVREGGREGLRKQGGTKGLR